MGNKISISPQMIVNQLQLLAEEDVDSSCHIDVRYGGLTLTATFTAEEARHILAHPTEFHYFEFGLGCEIIPDSGGGPAFEHWSAVTAKKLRPGSILRNIKGELTSQNMTSESI